MHDEATTYWSDMIENMALGHKFLVETFGVKPKVGWQLDSFGHSSANADLFSKMGFNALFFARIDKYDKNERINTKRLEMIWKPETGTAGPRGILAHTLYNHYRWPSGFCFDDLCSDR